LISTLLRAYSSQIDSSAAVDARYAGSKFVKAIEQAPDVIAKAASAVERELAMAGR